MKLRAERAVGVAETHGGIKMEGTYRGRIGFVPPVAPDWCRHAANPADFRPHTTVKSKVPEN